MEMIESDILAFVTKHDELRSYNIIHICGNSSFPLLLRIVLSIDHFACASRLDGISRLHFHLFAILVRRCDSKVDKLSYSTYIVVRSYFERL